MASSLSNLVNKHSERIHRIKCKFIHEDKKCETWGINFKYCDCFLKYINFKDDLIEEKSLCCNKNYQYKFDGKLTKRVFNTYNFVTMTIINLLCYCKKVYILMDKWMIGKNSMKHDIKNEIFTVSWIWKLLLLQITHIEKEFVKILK